MGESSFDEYPGIRRHGDGIRITDRGSCVIEDGSDANLDRGGIRMGTAASYRVVESLNQVTDSLVIVTSTAPVRPTSGLDPLMEAASPNRFER
jgi:acetoacetyl-CoA synthetase